MILIYPDKLPADDVLRLHPGAHLIMDRGVGVEPENLLIHGDNLAAMLCLLREGEATRTGGPVDLVYIDPPFSTGQTFRRGVNRTATISPAASDEIAYADHLDGAAFLEFLRRRLIVMRELMTDHASIFVHIDVKIGHYVKVILDEVFGRSRFRNDIARIKCNPKNFARRGFGNSRDMVLFYSRGDDFIWHEPAAHLTDADLARLFPRVDAEGRRYTTTPLHAPGETRRGPTGRPWRDLKPPPGRHWRYPPSTLDELDAQGLIEWSSTGNPRKIIFADVAEGRGKKLQDVWNYKDPPYPQYPTAKNLEMLEMIVGACTDPGMRVLDAFCGSGSTLLAAERLDRRWIGIDASQIAIDTAVQQLQRDDTARFRRAAMREPAAAVIPCDRSAAEAAGSASPPARD